VSAEGTVSDVTGVGCFLEDAPEEQLILTAFATTSLFSVIEAGDSIAICGDTN
jgi:hypothetical protein